MMRLRLATAVATLCFTFSGGLFLFADDTISARAAADINWKELEPVVQREMEQSRTPGAAVAVVIGERVIYAQGFGIANVETNAPVTPDMLFRLGSTTKMFTAASVAVLADQGKLSLDEPIGKHVSGLHPRIAALTAHQLLTHTAGLTDEAPMSGPHDESALLAAVRAIDGSWLFAEPGKIHSYSNPGYWLAGALAQEAAGKPYADLLDAQIFAPAGMSRTTLRPLMAMTYPLALGHDVRDGTPVILRPQADNAATWPAGQMFSSVTDLARLVVALMHEGWLDGKQVLPAPVVRKLMTGHVPRPGGDERYGYGLMISHDRGVRIVQHGGSRAGYGSTIRMAPDQKVAVIVLANRTGSGLARTASKALELALPLKTPAESKLQERRTPLESEIATLAGSYTNNRQTLEIVAKDGRLWLKQRVAVNSPRREIELTFVGDNRLVPAAGEVATGSGESPSGYVIVRDGAGNCVYLCSSGRALRKQP